MLFSAAESFQILLIKFTTLTGPLFETDEFLITFLEECFMKLALVAFVVV